MIQWYIMKIKLRKKIKFNSNKNEINFLYELFNFFHYLIFNKVNNKYNLIFLQFL